MKLIAAPGGGRKLTGVLRPPGDKSVSHRAFLFSALAAGTTTIHRPLLGADARATLRAVAACGAEVDDADADCIRIVGRGQLFSPQDEVDCGNAGTLMRLLCGAAAGANIECRLVGDESLSRRPMRRVTGPLQRMGAKLETEEDGTPPVALRRHGGLTGIDYDSPVASAQVKSALLLAGLRARGTTTVTEPHPSRDHTERMLSAFGAKLKVDRAKNLVRVDGDAAAVLRPPDGGVMAPADISSAAFFLTAAAICPGSDLLLTDVGVNPTRAGVINILRRMGADITLENPREWCGEPAADLRVRGPARLRGTKIGGGEVALAIDELPAVMIAAACAEGPTIISGAGELRVKESDRIAAMAAGFAANGITTETKPDGIIVPGAAAATGKTGGGTGGKTGGAGGAPGGKAAGRDVFAGGVVDSLGDHRIAMSFAVAALRAAAPLEILRADNVATSFPRFAAMAQSVGLAAVEAA